MILIETGKLPSLRSLPANRINLYVAIDIGVIFIFLQQIYNILSKNHQNRRKFIEIK
ncbi:hypothetical protein EVA_03250 [gut metagenome]|uniref:Uncharacterized protein n=1 Tax=gut metagenome TaxID=749906 RepID=J9GLA2_9ZZZZ